LKIRNLENSNRISRRGTNLKPAQANAACVKMQRGRCFQVTRCLWMHSFGIRTDANPQHQSNHMNAAFKTDGAREGQAVASSSVSRIASYHEGRLPARMPAWNPARILKLSTNGKGLSCHPVNTDMTHRPVKTGPYYNMVDCPQTTNLSNLAYFWQC
jgi:hypothetical protein